MDGMCANQDNSPAPPIMIMVGSLKVVQGLMQWNSWFEIYVIRHMIRRFFGFITTHKKEKSH